MPPPTLYAVAADVVAVAAFEDGDRVLLIRRANPPPGWAIPGGFVEPDEDLPVAARRELLEETGVAADWLVQIGAYGHPERDPRGRTIGVVYGTRLSSVPEVTAADDAADASWFSVDQLPEELAFDHRDILQDAIARLRGVATSG